MGTHPIVESDFDCLTVKEKMSKKGKMLLAVYKRGKDEVVDKNCVAVKLVEGQVNVKKELYYKKHNIYDEANFDSKIDFDDIEPGMTIQAWWPYQETATAPKEGRWRVAHVTQTELPRDDRDDEDLKINTMLREEELITREMARCETNMLEGMFTDFLNSVDLDNLPKYDQDEQKKKTAEAREKIKDREEKKTELVAKIHRKRAAVSEAIAWHAECDTKLKKQNETVQS